MEIRLQPLVVTLSGLALIGALAYFALPRLLPLAAQLGLRPAVTATVAASPVPAGGPENVLIKPLAQHPSVRFHFQGRGLIAESITVHSGRHRPR